MIIGLDFILGRMCVHCFFKFALFVCGYCAVGLLSVGGLTLCFGFFVWLDGGYCLAFCLVLVVGGYRYMLSGLVIV